jgi:hypothetical protein
MLLIKTDQSEESLRQKFESDPYQKITEELDISEFEPQLGRKFESEASKFLYRP